MEYPLDFPRAFHKRTLELLTDYHGPRDATMLMNTLLGLIVYPRERLLHLVPNTPISALESWSLHAGTIKAIGRGPATLHSVIVGLRNAAVHGGVLPRARLGKVSGFEFRDRSGFHAVFRLAQLRNFVEALAAAIREAREALANKQMQRTARGPTARRR